MHGVIPHYRIELTVAVDFNVDELKDEDENLNYPCIEENLLTLLERTLCIFPHEVS